MADPVTPAADAAPAEGIVTPPAAVPAAAPPAPADAPLVNYKEVVELRKEVRNLAKLVEQSAGGRTAATAPTAVAPAAGLDPMAALKELRMELDLERAFAKHSIGDERMRTLLTKAAKADGPENVSEWVAQNMGAPAAPPAPAVAPVAPANGKPIAPSNAGAPAPAAAVLPSHPSALSQAAIDAMTPSEALKYWNTFAAQNGAGNKNPFARSNTAGNGGDLQAAAQLIAQALAQMKK